MGVTAKGEILFCLFYLFKNYLDFRIMQNRNRAKLFRLAH